MLYSSRVEIELFPYIHPLFKITMSWSNGFRIKDVIELYAPDVSQSSWVFVIEFCHQFWCRNFGGRFPKVVFVTIPFLLDEILESSLVPTTVKYLFYLLLCFSGDNYGQWVIFRFPSCDRVVQSWSKLHYVEHWMELLHLVWQP